MVQQRSMSHAVESSTLADVLERVLDKGIVIAGDIRVKLVDIELLSVQIQKVSVRKNQITRWRVRLQHTLQAAPRGNVWISTLQTGCPVRVQA